MKTVLEPEAAGSDMTTSENALRSIAISLKRIADALDAQNKQPTETWDKIKMK